MVINHGSPQARGLVAWWPMSSSRTQMEMVGQRGEEWRLQHRMSTNNDIQGYRGWATDPELGLAHRLGPTTANEELHTGTWDGGAYAGPAALLDGGTACTISLWMYRESGTQQDIGFKAATSYRAMIDFYTDNHLHAVVENGGSSWPYVPNGGAFTGKCLVTLTYDGTRATALDRCRLYKDGRYLGTLTDSGGPTPATLPSAANHKAFYVYFSGTSTSPAPWVADIRVYDRCLSDAEVWSLYDPRTRWELYAHPTTKAFIDLGTTSSTAKAGVVVRPRGARQAPSGRYELNTYSPQAQDLIWWWPGIGQGFQSWPETYTHNHPAGTASANGMYPITNLGLAYSHATSGTVRYDNINAYLRAKVVRNMTMFARAQVGTTWLPNLAEGTIIRLGWTVGTSNFFFGSDSSGKLKFLYRTGLSAYDSVTCSTLAIPQDRNVHTYGCRRDGASIRIWLDGKYEDLTLGTNVDVYHGGSSVEFFVAGWPSGWADVRIYNTAVPDGVMAEAMHPQMGWDLYAVPSSRIYFDTESQAVSSKLFTFPDGVPIYYRRKV